ncbi:glucosaminidase domain-containing protein [Paenibacillus sp. MMO-58]|uniref:glucosaminidase domain-containing protein n=1 Tax=Paenibacillus sp. MMO-58 TaxID=3081290 RepID=UPI0030163711
MPSFEQAGEYLKKYLKHAIKTKIRSALISHFAAFWYVYVIIIAAFLLFYLIAAAISSSQSVAAQSLVSDKYLPPQIYISNLGDTITSNFGERIDPVTGAQSFHDGIDLGLPLGTPVASSTDGVVTKVSYPKATDPASTKDAGIYVSIQSTDPDLEKAVNRYLHLRDAYVITGQTVKKGQIIGLSGNSGKSTGPHLHYELIPDQDAVDPTPFIATMSQILDVASDAAFTAMEDIDWSNMTGNDYQSDQMLYVSNTYMSTQAPAFTSQGTVYIRDLNGGTIISSGGTSVGGGSVGPIIQVPDTLGTLTNPFFIKYAPYAMAEEDRSGVKASITLAQMALESAYGRSDICNNLFGIKANSKWTGPTCSVNTNEQDSDGVYTIRAKFRAYSSFAASIADHSSFLLENPRYRTALSQSNPYAFANELQRATYATDLQYANKLKSIMRSQNLVSLDRDRGINPSTGKPWQDVPYNVAPPVATTPPITSTPSPEASAAPNTSDQFVITFGIQQVYGDYAKIYHNKTVNGHVVPTPSTLIDPYSGQPVFNLVDYNNVVNLTTGEVHPPSMYVKDVPDAIAVTLSSSGSDDLNVIKVDYIKGQY